MWPFKGIPTFVKDRTVATHVLEQPTFIAWRNALNDHIDAGGFQKWVVFISGIGFFAGAYQIFAVGITLPIIELVYYYPNKMGEGAETCLRVAILLGAMVGQLGAGFLADIYGRRRVYGWELLILLGAIWGVTMASRGEGNSMSVYSWMFAWRFIMGIGIGADYPLSAAFVCEFAPTKHRGRMLAWTFYAQPLGYLFAAIVSIAVLASHREAIPLDLHNRTCDQQCRQALDRSWRSIIGVGAIFAIVAVFFRRTTPESPRYTAYVLKRPNDAKDDVDLFIVVPSDHSGTELPTNQPGVHHASSTATVSPKTSNIIVTSGSISGASSQHISPQLFTPGPSIQPQAPSSHVPGVPQATSILPQPADDSDDDLQSFEHRSREYWADFRRHFGGPNRRWRVLVALSIAWFCLDSAYYALIGASASKIATKVFDVLPVEYNCTLISNSALGSAPNCTLLNYSATNPSPQSIYGSLFDNLWRVLILVCAGSVPAGLGMIYLVQTYSLRRIQMLGFVILGFILIITGAILRRVDAPSVTAATIPFYLLAQVFFEIGPNFTTWMLAVELFPTRHRAFSHGIAAASGKAGAVLFQVFFQKARFPGGLGVGKPGTEWLGLAIICFMPFMFVGAFVTYAWVPETRDEEGFERRLEELENLTRTLKGGNIDIENPSSAGQEVEMTSQS